MGLHDEKSMAEHGYASPSGDPVRGCGLTRRGKRAFDIIAATIGLILFSPLLLLSCIAIAIETRGPVALHEELYDYDNRIVRAFRLRLVKAYADEPTLSRIGRVLLDTGIPELPQLLNVLRGEMSIIGPRLYVGPQSVFAFSATARLSGLKPGLIALAPLGSHHEQSGTGKQSLYDALHYTDNWSLSLDIRIILTALFSAHTL